MLAEGSCSGPLDFSNLTLLILAILGTKNVCLSRQVCHFQPINQSISSLHAASCELSRTKPLSHFLFSFNYTWQTLDRTARSWSEKRDTWLPKKSKCLWLWLTIWGCLFMTLMHCDGSQRHKETPGGPPYSWVGQPVFSCHVQTGPRTQRPSRATLSSCPTVNNTRRCSQEARVCYHRSKTGAQV